MVSKVYSVVTGRVYEPIKMCYLSNYMQASAYMENGAILYDVLAKDKILTFVFAKDDTRELYVKWKEKLI